MEFCDIKLTREPIQSPESRFSSAQGAVVDFFGVVRAVEGGRIVAGIDYEAFEKMAVYQLSLIANQTRERFGLGAVTIWHRIGFVPAGEASLFVRVTAGHRPAAFEGSMQIIDKLKAAVPIWKHPIFVQECASLTS